MSTAERPDAASHYNRVTDAWQYLLGEDLHYGYFEHSDLPLAGATDALTRLLAREAKLEAGMRVLDVGCGTGSPALVLAREYHSSVLGISTSEIGVQRARARAARANMSHQARFELGDGTAMELDADFFDCVWVMESSHLMLRKDLLLKQGFRVLRPGGRLVLCDIMLLRQLPFGELLRIYQDVLNLDKVFGRATMSQLSRYAGWAREAGFTVITARDISRETMPTFRHWRTNADCHSSLVEELLGPGGLVEFRVACDFLQRVWLDWLGYGLLVVQRTA